ncbi:MAG TPA: aminotransferase class I/II-fold pyridoxal phosphate-dependent enzyme, partial [Solirubrobacteraceae bacterium]
SDQLRTAVDQVRQPFYANWPAQVAATEALRHEDEVTDRVTRTIATRLGLEDGLRELGLPMAESEANFVWHGLPEGVEERDVVDGLAQRGVLVRAGTALGREGWLRVTVGTDAEIARYLAELRAVL